MGTWADLDLTEVPHPAGASKPEDPNRNAPPQRPAVAEAAVPSGTLAQTRGSAARTSRPPVERMVPEKPASLTVSQLNARASSLLEQEFGVLTVEGELSGFAPHTSGHWYFTLKDAGSQITAVCFKGNQRGVDFTPKSGELVTVRGKLSIYGPRGSYQLMVSEMRRAGQGALQQRFEALKAQLQSEGLFAQDRKRILPVFPQRIALITSADGAAVRDFLKIAVERNPALDALIIATSVQGPGSVEKVTAAIRFVSREAARLGVSMLVLTRGGGSQEDLWTFNEESVVRALAQCSIPTVSAIGHEVDFSLCDFAADLRAATPTDAARKVVPDMVETRAYFTDREQRLTRIMGQEVERARHRLARIEHQLADPSKALVVYRQRLDQALSAAQRSLQLRLRADRERVQALQRRVDRADPARALALRRARLEQLHTALKQLMATRLQRHKQRLGMAASRMEALSPLGVLSRGYSLTTRADDNSVVHRAADAPKGTSILIRLQEGHIKATTE